MKYDSTGSRKFDSYCRNLELITITIAKKRNEQCIDIWGIQTLFVVSEPLPYPGEEIDSEIAKEPPPPLATKIGVICLLAKIFH